MKVGDLVRSLEGTYGIIVKIYQYHYPDKLPRVDVLHSSGRILISISQLALEAA